MPIQSCTQDGKPGYRWGNTNKCWTYTPGDEASRKEAKRQVVKQALVIEGPKNFKKIMGEVDEPAIVEEMTQNKQLSQTLGKILE
jgi:hypothetical protein